MGDVYENHVTRANRLMNEAIDAMAYGDKHKANLLMMSATNALLEAIFLELREANKKR
jgi:hypothetical protein